MKAIKMTGLAVLTALTMTAFGWATSAMAGSTSLCKADENPCAEGNQTTAVHEESFGWAKLLTSIGTVECAVLFSGETLGSFFAVEEHVVWGSIRPLGSPLLIVGNFTYSGCFLSGGKCTVKEESGPAEIKVLREGHETAKVTGEGLAYVVCGSSLNCSYNGTGLVGTAKGPLLSTLINGEVSLSGQETTKEVGGFLCPKTAKLDITTTPLTASYISS